MQRFASDLIRAGGANKCDKVARASFPPKSLPARGLCLMAATADAPVTRACASASTTEFMDRRWRCVLNKKLNVLEILLNDLENPKITFPCGLKVKTVYELFQHFKKVI